MKYSFLVLALFCASAMTAQSDEDLIRHTLHNYFYGTAYSQPEMIKAAFHPQTLLFLQRDTGEPVMLTVDEYTDLFRKRTAGTFTGRYNKIISIERTGNLAQAKAEITIPAGQRIYTDIFILRRMEEDRWLIIGKAANSRTLEMTSEE